jgi:hypothetical protein
MALRLPQPLGHHAFFLPLPADEFRQQLFGSACRVGKRQFLSPIENVGGTCSLHNAVPNWRVEVRVHDQVGREKVADDPGVGAAHPLLLDGLPA